MGKEQQSLPRCPFCGSDDIGVIDQTIDKVDGSCVTYDGAECNDCCAQAPLDKWIAFGTAYAELKAIIRITREACEDAVRNTRIMSAELDSLQDVTRLMHGD